MMYEQKMLFDGLEPDYSTNVFGIRYRFSKSQKINRSVESGCALHGSIVEKSMEPESATEANPKIQTTQILEDICHKSSLCTEYGGQTSVAGSWEYWAKQREKLKNRYLPKAKQQPIQCN